MGIAGAWCAVIGTLVIAWALGGWVAAGGLALVYVGLMLASSEM